MNQPTTPAPPPQEKEKTSIRVVLPVPLHQKCKMKAALPGQPTMTQVCRDALDEWVNVQRPIILLPLEEIPEKPPTARDRL